MDASVAWFALGLTLLTGLLFGIAPALRGSRNNLNDVLRQGGRGLAHGTGARLRNTLAAIELALATVLLIGAGLLLQSLANLQRVRLGFQPHGLITFQLSPPPAKYPLAGTGASHLYRSLIDRLTAIPGVRGAAVSSGIPFGAGNYTTHPMFTTGQSLLSQWVDPAHGETFWTQDQIALTPAAGTAVTINDTAPKGSTWDLAAAEILPARS